MQLTCLYHPVKEMIVTEDEEEFETLLASGVWFKHPNDAENMRKQYEERLQNQGLHPKKRQRRTDRKQASIDGPSTT